MKKYKFDGIVKSALEGKKVVFYIEPTAQFRKKIVRGEKVYDVWLATSEGEDREVVMIDKSTTIWSLKSKADDALYSWLCTHADTGRVASFEVEGKGRLGITK